MSVSSIRRIVIGYQHLYPGLTTATTLPLCVHTIVGGGLAVTSQGITSSSPISTVNSDPCRGGTILGFSVIGCKVQGVVLIKYHKGLLYPRVVNFPGSLI